MLSKSVLSALVFCAMAWATLTACEGANGADAYPAQRRTAALAENPPRAEGSVSVSELDRNALEMAEHACANRDFPQLFTAIAISPAVRRKYSAPTIASAVLDAQGRVISSRDVPANSYEDFPVRQVDFYYKPAKPRAPGDEDEYLDISSTRARVTISRSIGRASTMMASRKAVTIWGISSAPKANRSRPGHIPIRMGNCCSGPSEIAGSCRRTSVGCDSAAV